MERIKKEKGMMKEWIFLKKRRMHGWKNEEIHELRQKKRGTLDIKKDEIKDEYMNKGGDEESLEW